MCGALVVYFFVFHNLTRFPQPWFDEGSHLHVPKTLVQYGVYADRSSEGFRFYGPTIGVGPTVMLPVAATFKVFGIGLLQARMVMAVFLIAAAYMFYRLVENISGKWVAWIALALMISSRSVLFLEYGRQLLGEVPGFFFLMLALYLWYSKWNENHWMRLTLIGLLFGLAIITKYQYLLFIAPTLIFAWLLDALYYKTSSHRHFLLPGLLAAGSFGIWQLITLTYLGPATALENWALLRDSAQGAAFNFNLDQLSTNLGELTSRAAYLGVLVPALIYGFLVSLPRSTDGVKRGIIFLLAAFNLLWYVVASIGWIRYAFPGLAISSIFVANLFFAMANGFKINWGAGLFRPLFDAQNSYRFAIAFWLLVIIMLPMAKTVLEIAFPEPASAQQMSVYLNENVSQDAVIETWDPEMGFLTNHNYHYPPNALLAVAVDQIYYSGVPVQNSYHFVQTEQPEYLLLGVFSKWTEIYPLEKLTTNYELVQTFEDYDLYRRIR